LHVLAAFFGAEACCKHVVDTAKSEVESNPNASRAMREFASIRLEDAEVGVRRVLIKCCLTAPTPISWIDLGEEPHQKNFPWVKLSSWAQHLLDTGLLPRVLVGVNDFATMIFFWTEFWSGYEEMDAGDPVFALERNGIVCRDRLVPFYSHSDEGTTLRDAALLGVECPWCHWTWHQVFFEFRETPCSSPPTCNGLELPGKHVGHPLPHCNNDEMCSFTGNPESVAVCLCC
jgi:hypothetical protein